MPHGEEQMIHELPGWPGWRWDGERLESKLAACDEALEELRDDVRRTGAADALALRRNLFANELLYSSHLEGADFYEESDDEDYGGLERAAAAAFGGGASEIPACAEVLGEIAMDAMRRGEAGEALTAEMLFGWQKRAVEWKWMVGRPGSLARWRQESLAPFVAGDAGPLSNSQSLVGVAADGIKNGDFPAKIHETEVGRWRSRRMFILAPQENHKKQRAEYRLFAEGVTAGRIEEEMARFLAWFNGESRALHPAVAAAAAHAWFFAIHPFSDGNGIIARALTGMTLARLDLGDARMLHMSQAMDNDFRYSSRLHDLLREDASQSDVERWLEWFAEMVRKYAGSAAQTVRFETAEYNEKNGVYVTGKGGPWIHGLADWPNYRWDNERLLAPLEVFDAALGELKADALRAEAADALRARKTSFRSEIKFSSLIERVVFDEVDMTRATEAAFGAPASAKPSDAEVFAAAAMAAIRLGDSGAALSAEALCGWQKTVISSQKMNSDAHGHVQDVGRWRTHSVMVGGQVTEQEFQVAFVAPAAGRVAGEMGRFLDWFNGESRESHPVVAAGAAHAWFENIHPFSDGNGRVGRMLIDVALGRLGLGESRLFHLSRAIHGDLPAYYRGLRELGNCKHGMDATAWLEWFVGAAQNAIASARNLLEAYGEVSAALGKIPDGELNERQKGYAYENRAPQHVRRRGSRFHQFQYHLDAGHYQWVTGCDEREAKAEFARLEALGLARRAMVKSHWMLD